MNQARLIILWSSFLCAVQGLTAESSADSETTDQPIHVNYYDLPWTEDPGLVLSHVARWKTLLGTGGIFGDGLPAKDLYIRQGEIGSGAKYPEHQHPSPELWYFISGRARWTVDGETFETEPGSTVYLRPGSIRALEIISKEKAFVVRGNWGINCDREILVNTFGSDQPGSIKENRGYIWRGEYTYASYPQPDRARLTVWDYGDSRQPSDGSNSNLAPPAWGGSTVHLKHINYFDVRFPDPPDPTGVRRWKTLVGAGSGDWGQGLPNDDIQWGVGELGSGGTYDDHQHASPELYYFVSGKAKIRVDGQEFIATPGELVYHRPWALHRSEIISKSKAVVMWADWAPDCDRSVLQLPYKVLGEVPAQPRRAILDQ